jgi:hypothetical protein
MMLLQLIWVQTLVVETKGVSLEQISERLSVPKELMNTETLIEAHRPLITSKRSRIRSSP